MALAMNLHAIVSPAIAAVNPNVVGDLYVSTGAVSNADYTRTPQFIKYPNTVFQVQAVSGVGTDGPIIQHLDSLNIQGVLRSVWALGDIEAVKRPSMQGGDVIFILGQWFLNVQLVETWDTSGWCHFIAQLQDGKPKGVP